MTIPPIAPILPPIASPAANPAGVAGLESAVDAAGGAAAGAAGGAASGFWGQVQTALQQMDQLQAGATAQVEQLAAGGASGDVHAAVIAVEKADLSFGMMLQLRNKAVQAYQDISHMSF